MTGLENSAKIKASERQAAYASLIVHVMNDKGVTKAELFRQGVIRKCTRQDFTNRLFAGDISAAELHSILEYLEIDPIRADLAISCFADPQGYHDDSCKVVSRFTKETVLNLKAAIAACDGDFEPLRDELCVALARKTSRQIIAQHRRTVALTMQQVHENDHEFPLVASR
ncbi:hypothetical protein [Croceicoccus mobilis]|uniref:Uncharacterized protein n=1 Tax=Croceicoccus mobilis TaxID=1703339 RepID=A0A916Z907_9SPHN|nr:hypothetical protein [Croceicoccus mobilis]GGD82230.1 hypothetical protein GCM10010990_35270 [Croceicoccus mobilis]